MTAEERAALVERVARRIGEAVSLWLYENPCCKLEDVDTKYIATAAIDLTRAEVLEEAARVADSYHRIVETKRDLFDDGNITVTKGHTLADPRKIAAAIRALKETKDGR